MMPSAAWWWWLLLLLLSSRFGSVFGIFMIKEVIDRSTDRSLLW
jgi:amino acid permease